MFHTFLVMVSPAFDLALQVWFHQGREEEKDHYHPSAGNTSNATQEVVGLCLKTLLLAHVHFVVHQKTHILRRALC